MSERKLQTSIGWCTVQLYVACVTPSVGMDAWTGTAIFSVARLFHFTQKLEQWGLIGDVSCYHIFQPDSSRCSWMWRVALCHLQTGTSSSCNASSHLMDQRRLYL